MSGPEISGSFGLNGIPFTKEAPEKMSTFIYSTSLYTVCREKFKMLQTSLIIIFQFGMIMSYGDQISFSIVKTISDQTSLFWPSKKYQMFDFLNNPIRKTSVYITMSNKLMKK